MVEWLHIGAAINSSRWIKQGRLDCCASLKATKRGQLDINSTSSSLVIKGVNCIDGMNETQLEATRALVQLVIGLNLFGGEVRSTAKGMLVRIFLCHL